MPTRDASDEQPSSSAPLSGSIHERPTRPADSLSEAAAAAPPRCPRCGGHAAPRRRVPSRHNPFLRSSAPSGQITCDDCGLDFGPTTPDSGKDPWPSKDS